MGLPGCLMGWSGWEREWSAGCNVSRLLRGLDERKAFGGVAVERGVNTTFTETKGQHREAAGSQERGRGLTLSCGSTRTRESHFQQGLG